MLPYKDLTQWQKEVVHLATATEPDARTVHWYVDGEGGKVSAPALQALPMIYRGHSGPDSCKFAPRRLARQNWEND